jgi:DNA end-binding protein Ku
VAPARPYWKGYLKLSLVSCPIALYSAASSAERVSFRQINKKTGNRLRQQLVDDATREPVTSEDKVRGYEYAKNTYVVVEDEELDAIAIESTDTIEIDSFVPRKEIDERYYDSPYYITPGDRVGLEAFAVIRDAMRDKNMVALGRVVLAKRERVVMLQPWDKGLMATSLRYPYEVRDAKEYFDDIPDVKVAPDMLTLAEHILDSKKADFEPTKFVDRYEEAVIDLLKRKQAGLPTPKTHHAPPPSNVVDLMEALRRSLGDKAAKAPASSKAPAAAAKAPAAKKGRKRVEGQKEMLLPIAGKKEKEPAKETAKPAARGTATRHKKAG